MRSIASVSMPFAKESDFRFALGSNARRRILISLDTRARSSAIIDGQIDQRTNPGQFLASSLNMLT